MESPAKKIKLIIHASGDQKRSKHLKNKVLDLSGVQDGYEVVLPLYATVKSVVNAPEVTWLVLDDTLDWKAPMLSVTRLELGDPSLIKYFPSTKQLLYKGCPLTCAEHLRHDLECTVEADPEEEKDAQELKHNLLERTGLMDKYIEVLPRMKIKGKLHPIKQAIVDLARMIHEDEERRYAKEENETFSLDENNE